MGPMGSGSRSPVGSPGGGAPQSMFGSAMGGPARSLPSLRKNPGIVVELAGEKPLSLAPTQRRGAAPSGLVHSRLHLRAVC